MLTIAKILRCGGLKKNPVGLVIRSLHRKDRQVAWQKPEIGWTKLNFDGSSKGKSGKASIGGVVRNHNAEFLLGYAESIGRTTSTIAEFAALRRGLELVLENGWNNVWLEGDSKILVDLILRKRQAKCAEVQKQISLINLIIPELDSYCLTHVYREGNRVADKLAKLGQRLAKPQVWWFNPPKEVLSIVNDDAEGKIVLRKK